MNKTLIWTTLGCCLIALAATVQGQNRKPGLWEVTSQVNMSMTGAPQMPAHTAQVCVTQAMIDKYGGPYSNPQAGPCQTSNIVKTPSGMTANLTCSGRMTMTGTIQSTFVDANTVKSTVQMTASMGASGQTMTMTVQATATYKGPDCGDVKPIEIPASK